MNITDIPPQYFVLGIIVWAVFVWLLTEQRQLTAAAILGIFFFMPAMVSIFFGGKHIPTGQLLLLFFGPILVLIYSMRHILVEHKYVIPVIFYILAVILSIIWNGIPFWEVKSNLLPMTFALLIYYATFDTASLRFLIAVFLLFVVISTFVAGLQYAGFSSFYIGNQGIIMDAGGFRRGIGLAQHFSQTGLYCAAALPISFIGFVTAKTRKTKMLWLIPALFSVAGITFTGLRAALIGGAFGVFVSLWFWNKRKIIPYLAVSIILILIFIVAVPVLRTSSMALVKHTETIDSSAMNRPVLAKMAINIWLNHPFFGGGPSMFSRTTGHIGDAHNTYLNTLVEYGLLGFIFFLSILFVAFKNLRDTIKSRSELRVEAIGLIGALSAACMVGLVHSFNYISMFWLFIALGLTIGKLHTISRRRKML